ncbi:MAG: Rieske 2Fe-2S domain-containing protein [Pseudomonadota bacterium]
MTSPPAAQEAPMPAHEEGIELCDGSALEERGAAVLFDVMLWDEPVRAFALRYDGRPVAYVNRCAHVPAEMDWQPGQFLDDSREWIICSIHGALYQPADGLCVGGPCRGSRLMPVRVEERGDKVYWYPSREIRPLFAPCS